MERKTEVYSVAIRAALAFFVVSTTAMPLAGQRGGGPPPPSNLPASPVSVSIPAISAEITGPGPMFESLMALDEYGNARGGIRNPYVDVPARKYGVRNEGASPPVPNAHPFVAVRDEAGRNQLCGLTGYEIALPAEQLRRLHRTSKAYQTKVAQRLDELTRQGWSLPVYRDVILADAATIEF